MPELVAEEALKRLTYLIYLNNLRNNGGANAGNGAGNGPGTATGGPKYDLSHFSLV
jgi:hypothetical protein